uniref:Flavin-containing monooxygenase n=1 Tax=Ditylenchus dipsaci TaxID=166011 RepID=A0A915E7C7_9BILA
MLNNRQDVLEHRQSCAIIGAGISGLASARWALLYGFKPVIFERSSSIGGKWRYTSDPSQLSVMKSTVLNTSKEMTAFSDFPLLSISLHICSTSNVGVPGNATVLNIARSNTHYKDGTWVVYYRQNLTLANKKKFSTVFYWPKDLMQKESAEMAKYGKF